MNKRMDIARDQLLYALREIHPLDSQQTQPHRYCMLDSTASAPRVTCCSLWLYWSRDLCSRHAAAETGWLGDVMLSRSDSERQRNLMTQDQCLLPVYYSQMRYSKRMDIPGVSDLLDVT